MIRDLWGKGGGPPQLARTAMVTGNHHDGNWVLTTQPATYKTSQWNRPCVFCFLFWVIKLSGRAGPEHRSPDARQCGPCRPVLAHLRTESAAQRPGPPQHGELLKLLRIDHTSSNLIRRLFCQSLRLWSEAVTWTRRNTGRKMAHLPRKQNGISHICYYAQCYCSERNCFIF